jgi:hypothetical protein
MSAIHFIKKKIERSYLVWLQESNKYIQLEEPAWFVFRKTVKRHKAETIAKECADRYDLTYEESLTFVNDIRAGIEEMNQPTTIRLNADQYPDELTTYQFKPYSTHFYRFGENLIKFSFETRLFEFYLHPLICHLETAERKDNPSIFELFSYHDEIVFRLNGEVKGVWNNEETHLVKGLIFMYLINVMFDKSDDFWLMTVHASAVTNKQKTILISAGPGSGKTTMAAMLQDRGYRLVSDDFVPIDRYSFYAWPFPIAMSVKQGSVNLLSELYPDLEQKPLTHISPEKSVRYLFPENKQEFSTEAFPVKEFIFIQYDQSVDFEFEKLDQIKGIKLLLDQSWISPTEGIAPILLNQLSQWTFHQLTYSNNQKALDAINNLFDHD